MATPSRVWEPTLMSCCWLLQGAGGLPPWRQEERVPLTRLAPSVPQELGLGLVRSAGTRALPQPTNCCKQLQVGEEIIPMVVRVDAIEPLVRHE